MASSRTSDDSVDATVAVVQTRVDALPDEDRKEVFDLVAELSKVVDDEERQSIWLAIREILAQKPIEVQKLSFAQDDPMSPSTKRWIDVVAAKVRALRVSRAWTQEALAEHADLPVDSIRQIEQAEIATTFKAREKIARAFGMDVEQIDLDSDESR